MGGSGGRGRGEGEVGILKERERGGGRDRETETETVSQTDRQAGRQTEDDTKARALFACCFFVLVVVLLVIVRMFVVVLLPITEYPTLVSIDQHKRDHCCSYPRRNRHGITTALETKPQMLLLSVGCLTSQQRIVYLRNGSAQTILRAATLR